MKHHILKWDLLDGFRSDYIRALENSDMRLMQEVIGTFKDNLNSYVAPERNIDMSPFYTIIEQLESYYHTVLSGEFYNFRRYQYSSLLFTYVFFALHNDTRFKELYCGYIGDHILESKSPIDIALLAHNNFNRVWYWMATGSGKTLLMYASVYMYVKCFAQDIKTLYIIVPSDELRKQHTSFMRWFAEKSWWYMKDGTVVEFNNLRLFDDVEMKWFITTISSLSSNSASLSNNSIMLMDEAHKGASNTDGFIEGMKTEFIKLSNSFLFEFSATFQEAFKNEKQLDDTQNIFNSYHLSSLIKYNLYDFNSDGFGKNYNVIEQPKWDDTDENIHRRLVCRALTNYALQLRAYSELERMPESLYTKHGTYLMRRSDNLKVYKPLFLWLSWKLSDDDDTSKTTLKAIIAHVNYIFTHLNEFESEIKNYDSNKWYPISLKDFYELLTGLEYWPQASCPLRIWYDKPNDEIKMRLWSNLMLINTWSNAKIAESLKSDAEIKDLVLFQDMNISTRLFDQVDKHENLLFLFGSKKFIEWWDSKRPSTILLFKMWWSSTVIATQILGRWLRLYGIDGDGFRHLNKSTYQNKNRRMEYLEQISLLWYDIAEFNKFIESLAGDTYKVAIIKKREYSSKFLDYLQEHSVEPDDTEWVVWLFSDYFKVLKEEVEEDDDKEVDAIQVSLQKEWSKLVFVSNIDNTKKVIGTLRSQYTLTSEATKKRLEDGSIPQEEVVKNFDLFQHTYEEIFGKENCNTIIHKLLELHQIVINTESITMLQHHIRDMEIITDSISKAMDSELHIFELDKQNKIIDIFMKHLSMLFANIQKKVQSIKYSEIVTKDHYLEPKNLIDELRLDFDLKKKEDKNMVSTFFGDAPKLIMEKQYEDLTVEQQAIVRDMFIQKNQDSHIYERLYYLQNNRNNIPYLHDPLLSEDWNSRLPRFSPSDISNLNTNEEEKIVKVLRKIQDKQLDEQYDIFYLRNLVGKNWISLKYPDESGLYNNFFPDFIFWFIDKVTQFTTVVYFEPKWEIDKNREFKMDKLKSISSTDVPGIIRDLFTRETFGSKQYNWYAVLWVMAMQ
jgi:superfamily II DNA or RNA helicase